MIAWTLAGTDSGGGAGIAADLRTFAGLGVHGSMVVCALTAQNRRRVHRIEYPSLAMVRAQIEALAEDLPPKAIKTGMLGPPEMIELIAELLAPLAAPLVCDPVLVSSSGTVLLEPPARKALVEALFPQVTLLTPNLPEAEYLLGRAIRSPEEVVAAAEDLRKMGPKAVLIKGGHGQGPECSDYFSDGQQQFWLTSPRQPGGHDHGTGCTLAAAISSGLALGEPLADAVVLAKTYLNQALDLGQRQQLGSVVQGGLPKHQAWLPRLSDRPEPSPALRFPSTGPEPLGFYPLVDSLATLAEVLRAGVRTAQLRIKGLEGAALAAEISASIALARQAECRLFINDYWALALEHQAYGVHLGQEDLASADLTALADAGLRLGVSTHGFAEVARVLAFSPSYVAMGPIFATQSKQVETSPRGLERLTYWCKTLDLPVVAIGGIHLALLAPVCQAGAQGVAVIGALTEQGDPFATSTIWLKTFKDNYKGPNLPQASDHD